MSDEILKGNPKLKTPTRRVFISHAHADRELGVALSKLLEHAFSGTVKPYFSSDPSPAGGIQPGDEWYSTIHQKLEESESVWVLATKGSISRPWLYWEAGIGRAVCPGGIVVLRVGLSQDDIPSPLSAYQCYDGLSVGEGGVPELLGKIGAQVGMIVQDAWLKTCAGEFVETAKEHQPSEEPDSGGPKLAPEDVSRIDGLVSRLEVAARRIESSSGSEADERDRIIAEMEAERERVTGSSAILYNSPKGLIDRLKQLSDAEIEVAEELDSDGDIVIKVTKGKETAQIYFRTSLKDLEDFGSVDDPRLQRLLTDSSKAVGLKAAT